MRAGIARADLGQLQPAQLAADDPHALQQRLEVGRRVGDHRRVGACCPASISRLPTM